MATWRAVGRSEHTRAVATALPGPTVRRHWGLRLAASLGALLFAVTISAALFRIVSVEYRLDPVTGWYVWVSGTAFVLVGTLVFLDREQRANGLLLIVSGILFQLPRPGLLPSIPVWAIFLMALSEALRPIVLPVVLLRFPERRLQKRYERVFIIVAAAWLLTVGAIGAVTWPCWATPTEATIWPWWLANCQLSDLVELALYWGDAVFAGGLILLLTLRILRTRGLDRRIYVPVHIASIFGGVAVASLAVWSLAIVYGNVSWEFYLGSWGDFAYLRGVCVALAVIPVMLFLANIGRRLMKLRIAGMVAEINLARTPESIQAALRRALDDSSLVIYLWSREHEQYVDTEGRPVAQR